MRKRELWVHSAEGGTSTELLTRIIRYLHGSSFLRAEVYVLRDHCSISIKDPREETGQYRGMEMPGDGMGAETTSKSH